jgi:hypothetical protein
MVEMSSEPVTLESLRAAGVEVPASTARFPNGDQYRIEIPSLESPVAAEEAPDGIDDVTNQEGILGPFRSVLHADDHATAIPLANHVRYGLTGHAESLSLAATRWAHSFVRPRTPADRAHRLSAG